MKVIQRKNKLVLAELDPNASYIMLVNPSYVNVDSLKKMIVPNGVMVQILITSNVNDSVRFVEIPKIQK